MRDFSLIGKVNIINTLGASLYVYKMQVLPNMSKNLVHKIEQILEKFIWNCRKPKLKMEILQGRKQDGGLRLVNFKYSEASLKIQWIARLHGED